MCDDQRHTCYCGKAYPCTLPNWVCPTRNEDEDQNMCEECLEAEAARQQAWADDGGAGRE
jgi:hypothetical protein